jgi:hypothetical protein
MTTNRALIIGSQTGGLTGVHSDVEVVEDALRGLGFTTTRCIERDATYEGIVDRYRGLIEDSAPGDAAVVYYSGHGGRQRNALASEDPTAPTWLQYLVPTDVEERADGRFHAVLAQELSLLQRQLTAKTPNVTTILDCCHSARMSRNAGLLPKARPGEAGEQITGFPWEELGSRWARIRTEAGDSLGTVDANPLAVRLVACSPDESAYELAETALGGPHGALTSTLVPVLKSAAATAMTWRDVIDVVRAGVMDLVPQQRPEVEGPLHRVLFTVDERQETGVLPIRVDDGVALLDGADLLGVSAGDKYAVVAAGGDPAHPLGTAVVDRIVAGRARLTLDGIAVADVPPGAAAHPVEVSLGARPVAVMPPGGPGREALVEQLERSALVRVVDEPVNVVATIEVGDGLRLLDAAGEPLHEGELASSPDTLATLGRDVATLARATHVRELRSGTGDAALPDDVEVTYARLLPGGEEVALAPSGEHLFNGDRLVVRCRNTTSEARFVSVIDVGISGTISIITVAEPDGTTLAAKETYEVGRSAGGALDGIELYWPPSIPGDGPRPETVITVVADEKVTGLGRLEQAGVTARARAATPRSALEQLVEDLSVGRRDARPPATAPKPTRYRVHRFDFLFHPATRPGEAPEPVFEIDERPDPSFRLVVPRAARPPKRVAVRLKELTVHSNRSFLATDVRVDALVVTVPPKGADKPYQAATKKYDRVKDGDRLPFDDVLVYEGPVGRFLDLAVWVSKAGHRDRELTDLLADEVTSGDAQSALVTLAGLAVAAPQAAAVAGSAAAVAALVRAGGRVLDSLQGKSIGVYRTTLLPHERFGAGEEKGLPGRHPAEGLLRAQDMSFAYEVIAV